MMKTVPFPMLHRPLPAPRWGWYLFVAAVAVVGCLPAVIVRFQIVAALEAFDAASTVAARSAPKVLSASPRPVLDRVARIEPRDGETYR